MNEYRIIEFNKRDKELIEILKKYSKINCRNELDYGYISKSLDKTDVGFSFYDKYKPLAFICVKIIDNSELHVSIICSIKNTNNLGSQLLNIIINFAFNNKYKQITLECDDKLETFYNKFNFFTIKRYELNFIDMQSI